MSLYSHRSLDSPFIQPIQSQEVPTTPKSDWSSCNFKGYMKNNFNHGWALLKDSASKGWKTCNHIKQKKKGKNNNGNFNWGNYVNGKWGGNSNQVNVNHWSAIQLNQNQQNQNQWNQNKYNFNQQNMNQQNINQQSSNQKNLNQQNINQQNINQFNPNQSNQNQNYPIQYNSNQSNQNQYNQDQYNQSQYNYNQQNINQQNMNQQIINQQNMNQQNINQQNLNPQNIIQQNIIQQKVNSPNINPDCILPPITNNPQVLKTNQQLIKDKSSLNPQKQYLIQTGLKKGMVLQLSLQESTKFKIVLSKKTFQKNQQFRIRQQNGKYQLFSLFNNYVIKGPGTIMLNGQKIYANSSFNQVNQFFQLVENKKKDGGFYLKLFSNLCVDVYARKTSQNTPIIQYQSNGGSNQTWYFKQLS